MSTIRLPFPFVRLSCLAALALGAAAPAHIAHAQVPPLKEAVPAITTTGTASAEVVPDSAAIALGVETERPKAADAARDNARAAQAIVGEIKAQGIEARDIKTLAVTLAPVYDETRDPNGRLAKRTLRGYIARNSLSIRVKDIEKAGSLAQRLMDKGANSLDGISFEYSQKETKYDALRADAVRDALRKANSYVSGLGLRLGRVLEIATQPPSPVRPALAARAIGAAPPDAAGPAIPVEAGVETLQTEVQVTWELAQ